MPTNNYYYVSVKSKNSSHYYSLTSRAYGEALDGVRNTDSKLDDLAEFHQDDPMNKAAAKAFVKYAAELNPEDSWRLVEEVRASTTLILMTLGEQEPIMTNVNSADIACAKVRASFREATDGPLRLAATFCSLIPADMMEHYAKVIVAVLSDQLHDRTYERAQREVPNLVRDSTLTYWSNKHGPQDKVMLQIFKTFTYTDWKMVSHAFIYPKLD